MRMTIQTWPHRLTLLATAYLSLVACEKKTTTNKVVPPKDIVARVNGSPITEFDLRQESRGHAGSEPMGAQRSANLETVVRNELLAQYAVEQGIDQDPLFLERMARADALYRAARRRELADVLFRRSIIDKASVSEDEARTYYQNNELRMKVELHVLQIMTRDEGQARKALAEIKGGAAFDQVAAKQFDKLPENAGKPWDLGFLRWRQLPPAWRSIAYDLKPGTTSDVIKGEGNRFWIINVVERREDSTATFDTLKPILIDDLKSQTIEKERSRLTEELRKKATVVVEERPAQPAHSEAP